MTIILSRRNLLTHCLAGFSLAATAPSFLNLTSRVFAGDPNDERILVVLQLSGGNDGLSMCVPFEDDAYYGARRQTAIAKKDALKLTDNLGLHPELKNIQALFGDGRVAIAQGVSYPNPNRSHFRSMDIWHTADERGRGVDTGWLGRAIDAACPKAADPTHVVNLGATTPYALTAERNKPITFEAADSYAWTGNPRDTDAFERLNAAKGPGSQEGTGKKQTGLPAPELHKERRRDGDDSGTVDWLHRVAVDARESSETIRRAARRYRPQATYPNGRLAADLRTVAALVRAGLKTRVYYVSFGGFDTHNGQAGRYGNLMRQLDPALGAFWKDLRAQGLSKKILMVAFSEFGRRVAENGSQGTDHGVAGPMLLFGDQVKGGVHGMHPSLTDLDRGDLKMQVDFRSVYSEVLDGWMGVDAARILGRRYPKLALLA